MLRALVSGPNKGYDVSTIPSYTAYLHCGIAVDNRLLLVGSKTCKMLAEVTRLIIVVDFSRCDGFVGKFWIGRIPVLKRICGCVGLWHRVPPVVVHFSTEVESRYS